MVLAQSINVYNQIGAILVLFRHYVDTISGTMSILFQLCDNTITVQVCYIEKDRLYWLKECVQVGVNTGNFAAAAAAA